MEKKLSTIKLFFLIILTLFFFSTSSLLARAALLDNNIDAYSFTFFRLLFGTITLFIIFFFKNKTIDLKLKNNWFSSSFLFIYAMTFSYAYINLDAGIGTLILFAVVQLLIMLVALIKKETITKQKLLGLCFAFVGLIYLLLPDEKLNISIFHSMLMIISGLAWALYTILGKNTKTALIHTSDNFLKATFISIVFYLIFIDNINFNFYGVFLAFLSGGITSSIGYLMWYYILPKITMVTSGIVQLIVPPLSIFLSVLILDELFTFKLFLSTDLILFGIAIAILNSKRKR
ncbi:DMT family transporter [Halarcobacter sp.]|uniref:DMT family transporter n=1 Tax=Halarcobacter sp. TaxID=2321133 RepID=UPI0029F55A9D|nr:DMT family transporter [Halarcobacter sp.]